MRATLRLSLRLEESSLHSKQRDALILGSCPASRLRACVTKNRRCASQLAIRRVATVVCCLGGSRSSGGGGGQGGRKGVDGGDRVILCGVVHASLVQGSVPGRLVRTGPFLMRSMRIHPNLACAGLRRNRGTFFRPLQIPGRARHARWWCSVRNQPCGSEVDRLLTGKSLLLFKARIPAALPLPFGGRG